MSAKTRMFLRFQGLPVENERENKNKLWCLSPRTERTQSMKMKLNPGGLSRRLEVRPKLARLLAQPHAAWMALVLAFLCMAMPSVVHGQIVVAWGYDDQHQTETPSDLTNAVDIAGGDFHSLALCVDGTVAAWGDNSFGQLNMPSNLNNVVAISAGEVHSLALISGGTVVAWGDNSFGQVSVPVNLSNVLAVAAGEVHSLALTSSGKVVGWGDNRYGQIAIPASLSNAVAVAAGGWHSLALKADGTVVSWGYNSYGETNVPAGLSNVLAVAGGEYHSLALLTDGTVLGWGDNSSGQTTVPLNATGVVGITAGNGFSLALKNDSTVVAWGNDTYNQTDVPAIVTNAFSLPSAAYQLVPIFMTNVVSVAAGAGGYHSLALLGEPWYQEAFAGFAITTSTVSNGLFQLAWTGGWSPFLVQVSTNLSGSSWTTALTTSASSASLPILPSQAFYRVASAGSVASPGSISPPCQPAVWGLTGLPNYTVAGADSTAETDLVQGFGVNGPVAISKYTNSLPLPMTVSQGIVSSQAAPGGYQTSIEVQPCSFVVAGGSVGYVPGPAIFQCRGSTPPMQPGKGSLFSFSLGGAGCPGPADLPCGLYRVTITIKVPDLCGLTHTLTEHNWLFVPSSQQVQMLVISDPNANDPCTGICQQNRVAVDLTAKSPNPPDSCWIPRQPACSETYNLQTHITHQVIISTSPDPNGFYYVTAMMPAFGSHQGYGILCTQANLDPAVSQAPAPPDLLGGGGLTLYTNKLTCCQEWNDCFGPNTFCGNSFVPGFQDSVNLTITAIAEDGCSLASRTLKSSALYLPDLTKAASPP
jgi:hypothetical protein